jgi:hypothetical protein
VSKPEPAKARLRTEVSRALKQIVILGGGTAGWIAANALAHRWANRNIDITLIESPDIGTVGVGEGSTPRLKIFLDEIGVSETDWMPRCNATYKNGISFANWSTRPGYETYFHPFASQLDRHTVMEFYYNTFARRQGFDVHAHPDRFFITAALSQQRLAPLPGTNFPFTVEYGYHFDAQLLGVYLRELAVTRGVTHIAAKVTGVTRAENGDIASLRTDTGMIVEGDFFIDCSGFGGVLIQKELDVPFISFDENLFNDSAVVLPTAQSQDIAVQTVSTALKYGWAWQIPLTHRIGNGYVYSSAFCSADAAETELRQHLGLENDAVEARHLRMRVGRVEKHWQNNCLALGLSQGFIEPLEATALNLVCNTIYDFIDSVDPGDLTAADIENFNDRNTTGFESIRDYIVAHYVMNTRSDTDYWRANGENLNISDSLKQILQIWKTGANLSQEMQRLNIQSSYTPMSWYCLLAGYGFYPAVQPDLVDNRTDMSVINDFILRCAQNFPTHTEVLESHRQQMVN